MSIDGVTRRFLTNPCYPLAALLVGLRDPYTQPHDDETDDLPRYLGASEEEIEQLNREMAA